MLSPIRGPQDLDRLGPTRLATLAEEIGKYLIALVACTGGHLRPDSGVVGLTIALHGVFGSSCAKVPLEVGHQTYVRKPLDSALPELAPRHRLVETVEDGVRACGVGTMVSQVLNDANVWVSERNLDTPVAFLFPGSQGLRRCGLTVREIAGQTEQTQTVMGGVEAPAGEGPRAKTARVARRRPVGNSDVERRCFAAARSDC
ncbi:1-deoxy-D-xylulose-5-phosphate synthase N-terminal domain-containing protein [Micromonospora sp. NPDC094482]|uniref:1-deoxy-D-xylulose-5-phosphate synthase N-terminal domain-containing protein n=1 Tax=unclassified Micromonospora TaxID=2617518 RepID=UPI0033257805